MSDTAPLKLNPISFADVAHGIISFDPKDRVARLILELVDAAWVQRLRRIRQTGNTLLVYMFAEHSRFGHSIGVAFLAYRLMKHLAQLKPELVEEWELAVGAAALLHDIGHVAPGSHLAERVWGHDEHSKKASHELLSIRVLHEDEEISRILKKYDPELPTKVGKILSGEDGPPPWAIQTISGGGWNADRGNWTIVDSAMCAVTYGRYNVFALLDAFQLTDSGELVLQENRLDALTHFFVARDSMYRQVYQHRVLQTVDSLTENLIQRLIDIFEEGIRKENHLQALNVFADEVMLSAMRASNYGSELSLHSLFRMTEPWWGYHVELWCDAKDKILSDLARRLRDRRLFKTIRISEGDEGLEAKAIEAAKKLGFDPKYYVIKTTFGDVHREKTEELPRVKLDNGTLAPIDTVEPLIAKLSERTANRRIWLGVPKEVKEILGRSR